MPNENAVRWIGALRSEEFSQTTGQLKVGDSYCCLGVLCELYRREHDEKWENDYGYDGSPSISHLPLKVKRWAGILNSGAQNALVNLNDNKHLSFPRIADELEENPALYFSPA